ncbi:putative WD domain, G-beta repeat [Trypanosoma cruzi]|nr:putative WD domain, G-beta repeat [Trypanosoma cruzi]
MLFVASEGKSRLIDLETKAVQRTCATTHIERRGLTYCASLKTVIAHQARGCTSFFSPHTQQPVQRSFTMEPIMCSACTADGVFLIGGTAEGNIYVWNILTGQLYHLVRAHRRCVTEITISSDQSLLVTASEDSVCKTWSLVSLVARGSKTVAPCSFFHGHTLTVNTCSFMESGFMVVTGSADRTCRIFNALTGQQQLVITLDDAPTTVRPSPGDEMLLIGSAKGSLFFVDLYGNASEKNFPISLQGRNESVIERKSFGDGHSGAILFIWFDPARLGYAIVGSENGALLWWSISTQAVHSEAFPRFSGGVLSMCYVPRDSLTAVLWPCVGLMKHPLDPSTTDYIISSLPHEGSAEEKKPVAAGPRRRCRESDGGGDFGDRDTKLRAEDKNDSDCCVSAIRRQREKNDELESLRDQLKVKLQMLTDLQGNGRGRGRSKIEQ